MIIKNFKALAEDKARRDALKIINAGIEAVLVKPAMRREVKFSQDILKIRNLTWRLSKYKKIFVVGAGKAAADMAESLEEILGNKIDDGIVVDTRKRKLSRIKVVRGTHPLTSKINVNATKRIIGLIENAKDDSLVICLISGGGSALLDFPRIPLKKQIELNKLLLKRGANIQEINTVRKHISFVKGGQLGKLSRSEMITLIVSDVVTNDLEIIASGPTVRDSSNVKDALQIQKKYGLPELPFVETPKSEMKNVTNILLVTNVPASEAMGDMALSLGYRTKILTNQLQGEARKVGKSLAEKVKKGVALIATGETTVKVNGNGKGGRNQEVALSAVEFLREGVIASCSSDGVDFITGASGGIVDEKTLLKARKLGLNPAEFLNNNDSYSFLRKVNGVIKTGKTGTNVGDLFLALGEK